MYCLFWPGSSETLTPSLPPPMPSFELELTVQSPLTGNFTVLFTTLPHFLPAPQVLGPRLGTCPPPPPRGQALGRCLAAWGQSPLPPTPCGEWSAPGPAEAAAGESASLERASAGRGRALPPPLPSGANLRDPLWLPSVPARARLADRS